MRRIFWLALGLGAGSAAAVLSSRWLRRQTQALAPANLGRQVSKAISDLGALVGEAAAEFRKGMAEKEGEIRSTMEEIPGRAGRP